MLPDRLRHFGYEAHLGVAKLVNHAWGAVLGDTPEATYFGDKCRRESVAKRWRIDLGKEV